MRLNVCGIWLLLLIGLVGLAGCSGLETGADGGGGAATPLAVECQVFYRESVTVGIQQEEAISFSADAEEMLSFADLMFQAQYVDGSEAWESRSLRLAVTAAGQEQALMAQLLQLDKQEAPRNQFEGGHGFTGLNYVYHPTSGAELQYYCLAK